MRLLKLGTFFKKQTENVQMNQSLLQLIKMFVLIAFCGHILACLWFGLGDIDSVVNWRHAYDLNDASASLQYMTSLYWAFTTYACAIPCPSPLVLAGQCAIVLPWTLHVTHHHHHVPHAACVPFPPSLPPSPFSVRVCVCSRMTTVGYGDINTTNNIERGVALLSMLVGASLFGYVVGNVTVLMENLNPGAALRREKMDLVKEFVVRPDTLPTRLPPLLRLHLSLTVLPAIQPRV